MWSVIQMLLRMDRSVFPRKGERMARVLVLISGKEAKKKRRKRIKWNGKRHARRGVGKLTRRRTGRAVGGDAKKAFLGA